MVAPIILYGSGILRKHSADITEEDNVFKITEMLFGTLKEAKGIGLAGPQINLIKRAFVIDTSPLIEGDLTVERFEVVFINRLIIDRSTETEVYNEGCLSIPGIYEEVVRPGKILVKYQDLFFNTLEEELNGIKAQIFQHEFDHLEGILFIDKINPLNRKLLTGKLNKIMKLSGTQKNITNYPNEVFKKGLTIH